MTQQPPQPANGKVAQHDALSCLVIVARHHGLHLSVAELVHDNVIDGDDVTLPALVSCARKAGLRARVVDLSWDKLSHLKNVLPAIVPLKGGGYLVLRQLELDKSPARVVLQDPNANDDALLVIDKDRFEQAWTSTIIILKRDYAIADEAQPFSLGLVAAILFRERRVVRDLVIAAVFMGLLALTPIIFWRILTDKVVYYKAENTFYVICVAAIVLIGFETVFGYLRRFLILHMTTRLDVKLATYMFDKVLNLPIDFFEKTQVGLIARDMNEMWRIRTFLVGQVFGTVLDSMTLIFVLPIMFIFSPLLTLIVLGIGLVIVAWLIIMLPLYRKRNAAVVAAEGQRGAFLLESLNGIRTVKSLALDARRRQGWDVHVARVAKLRYQEGLVANTIQTVVLPFERLMVSGTFAVGVFITLSNADPVYIGSLFAFLMLSMRVAGPLAHMAQLVNQYDEARLAVAMVGRLVNQPEEEGRSGHGVKTPIAGELAFSSVTFKYPGAVSPALQNVSFEVALGTTLGIMGRSGSGKTTITRLLQRLYSNYDGLIKIHGIDVREFDVDHLRRSLGVVMQENFLFSGTIRQNIMMGKSDASFDEVVRAARLAGAEEFIDRLPRGYDTFIYEGSSNLSGGQRQRLAIARALIVDPRILILDEATSSLDAESEAIVCGNLARIAQGRTLIIISHRLSSLVTSDAILVLERGVVHDIGKHEELLARCDIYRDLWHQQNQHVLQAGSDKGKGVRRSTTLVS